MFRYLSPVRPGLRILPPETSTPNTQPSSQPPTQPISQPARSLKSNSLSLFYKKCKPPISPERFQFHGVDLLKGKLSLILCLQCTGWPTRGWKRSAPTCCPFTLSWSQSFGPCSSTLCSTNTSWCEIATSTRSPLSARRLRLVKLTLSYCRLCHGPCSWWCVPCMPSVKSRLLICASRRSSQHTRTCPTPARM